MEIKDFECFTVEILNEESSIVYGAFINYEQAKNCFNDNKFRVGDDFHTESYGIAIIGWKNGDYRVLDEWQLEEE
jgi:hypothetical protein